MPLVGWLIQAGVDLNFQKDGKGDAPLIGAASLGAEDVGLKLFHAGAKPGLRGLFGETALHWAALLGEDRLGARLIAGSDVKSQRWKIQLVAAGLGRPRLVHPPAGNHGRQREVAALLVSAGARVEPQWLESEKVYGDPEMFRALGQSR